ncbi:restriction endonuclease subunit S [Haemophilus paraphrohaemolyticus]|uniref:Restriction endonuclease subunit S n=1 Tax=Haemophilus paraphrohaemolyticus TaxID=736 RepID=A0A369ZTQ6_9PAST|nr:restriction endonuclease subunit S [Haemophilus paraphrohaemolyticus]RDF11807.1 restriction endonuclease subunit S [Haemophilus paraphrohaemolyticus]
MSNLGQHLKFSNGKTSPNRTDTGFYPVYGANGIIGYSSEYNSDENTIIIGRVGSYCGSVHFSDKKCWVTDNAISARSMNLKESIFWFYYLKSLNLNSMRVGSGQPLLNQTILKSISLPDLNINKIKVGEILLSFDQKIDLNTQINQTLEQIAQALFKSWFVDFDPVRVKVLALSDGLSLEQAELAAMQAISGKTPEELTALLQTQPDRYAELAETAKAFPCEMVEVDGVEVPKGWEVKALDEIANYQNGLALQKFRPEDDEPFLPVVKIAQLRQGYADGEEKAKASIKPECIIDNGDVIFSWSGSLLVDIWCGGKAALNQHLFKVTSKRYPKWFYYFYTKYHLAEFQRIAYDKAVTMGHIKREHLSAAKCIVPNDELLANKTLENILGKIIFNRLENFNLQNTRDLLLPRLLNGEMQL